MWVRDRWELTQQWSLGQKARTVHTELSGMGRCHDYIENSIAFSKFLLPLSKSRDNNSPQVSNVLYHEKVLEEAKLMMSLK